MATSANTRPAAVARDLARLDERLSAKPAAHLKVNGLSIGYSTLRGRFHAVEDVSFEVRAGTNLGLVGESGCGKSTVVKALMGLLPEFTALSGEALLDGENILGLSDAELEPIRWNRISLITQSAMNSLDPVYCIGDQICEAILAHEKVSKAVAWARAEEMFALVGLPAERLYEFPHQFSGGMRSVRSSPWRWRSTPACCWPTSRPPRSTRSCNRRSCRASAASTSTCAVR